MFTPDSILTSFSYILELSPYHLLAYYPFRNKLRYPPWLLGLLVGGLLFLEFLTCCYLYSTGKDARSADLVFALIAVIIFFACVDAQLPKLIFIYVLVLDYVMIIRGISVFLIIRFFCPQGEPYLLLSSPSGIIIRLIPCLLLLPFMMYFFNITQKRVLESNAPKLWATFWLLPTMTTLIVFLFTYDFNTISTAGLIFLLARVFLLFSSIIIYHIFISSLESLRLQGEAEERIRSQEQFMALQKLQYARLQKQIEETRQARHDLRQHLNLIQAYLDTGDNETLQEYIRKYGQRLPLAPEKVYCSNYAIDTIIRYYGEKAESLGIRFCWKTRWIPAAPLQKKSPLSESTHRLPGSTPYPSPWITPAPISPPGKTGCSNPPSIPARGSARCPSATSPPSTTGSLTLNTKTGYFIPLCF